jgi:hypothetical protein
VYIRRRGRRGSTIKRKIKGKNTEQTYLFEKYRFKFAGSESTSFNLALSEESCQMKKKK